MFLSRSYYPMASLWMMVVVGGRIWLLLNFGTGRVVGTGDGWLWVGWADIAGVGVTDRRSDKRMRCEPSVYAHALVSLLLAGILKTPSRSQRLVPSISIFSLSLPLPVLFYRSPVHCTHPCARPRARALDAHSFTHCHRTLPHPSPLHLRVLRVHLPDATARISTARVAVPLRRTRFLFNMHTHMLAVRIAIAYARRVRTWRARKGAATRCTPCAPARCALYALRTPQLQFTMHFPHLPAILRLY